MEKFQIFKIYKVYPGIPGLPQKVRITMEDIRQCLPHFLSEKKFAEKSLDCEAIGVYEYNYLVGVKARDDMSRVETALSGVRYGLFKLNEQYFLILFSDKRISDCPGYKVFQVELSQPVEFPCLGQTYFEKISDETKVWVHRRTIADDLFLKIKHLY